MNRPVKRLRKHSHFILVIEVSPGTTKRLSVSIIVIVAELRFLTSQKSQWPLPRWEERQFTLHRKSSLFVLNHLPLATSSPSTVPLIHYLLGFSWSICLILRRQGGDNSGDTGGVQVAHRLEQTLDVVELTFGK